MRSRKIAAAAAVVMTAVTASAASLGADTPPWNGALTVPGTPTRIRAAGIRELEFNGGPMSDLYHWRTGRLDPLAATYHYADMKPAYGFGRAQDARPARGLRR